VRRHAKASSAGSSIRQVAFGSFIRRAFAVGLLMVALVLSAFATSAMASLTTRARTLSFGSDGTPLTGFTRLGSTAFDQANHRLYVVEATTPAVLHAFDTPSMTPTGGAFPKTLVEPSYNAPLAVDNSSTASAGHVFFVSENKLFGFDSSGAPLGGNFPVSLPGGGLYIGAAVDSAGSIYIANGAEAAKNIRKYDSAGNLLGTISTAAVGDPGRLAFDSNDDLYFGVIPLGQSSGQNNEGTWRATASSGYSAASLTRITSDPPGASPEGITLDPATHTLYVAELVAGKSSADAYDALTGAHLYGFAGGIAGAKFQTQIAFDQSTGAVYIPDFRESFTEPNTAKVYRFAAAQSYADATATPIAATEIIDTSAKIGATVSDNNVLPTNWRLELSENDGDTWSGVQSGQTTRASASTANTGLSSGTLTIKAAGGTFTLIFQGKTTTPLPYNSSAATVKSALEALSTIGAGNVNVTNGPGSESGSTPYNLTFTGALAGTEVSKITPDPTNLLAPTETETATVTGLHPNSDYRFRVVTNKGSTAATEVTSFPLFFKTVAPPPVISDVGAIQVNDTSMRLVGTIDPRNTTTGYVFQYGTTPALGSSTAPLAIGTGTKPITVSQVLTGLAADTTYYFRLLATNQIGTTTSATSSAHTRAVPFPPANPGNCANEAIRQAQSSTYLPDCRAYEMVSPSDKNHGRVEYTYTAGFSRDGTGAAFCTLSLFGEPAGQMTFACAPYISHRGAEGWSTESAGPRFCNLNKDVGPGNPITRSIRVVPSPESFDRLAVNLPEIDDCPIAPLDPAASVPAINFYRQDMRVDPFGYDLLAPNAIMSETDAPFFGVGTPDFSHIVYGDSIDQTPDSPPGDFMKLYDWEEEGEGGCATPGGCLSLLSVDPAGEPFEASSRLPSYFAVGSLAQDTLTEAISEDGDRVYFQNPTVFGEASRSGSSGTCIDIPSCDLYLREDGTTTFKVSASECTASCGIDSSPDPMVWASPSGDKALFESCAKLTDDSSPATSCATNFRGGARKLYRWDRDAAPGHRLHDLSIDEEPADGTQPLVQDILGASDDGDTVYFIARSQLVAGAASPLGQFGEPKALKLYRWRWNDGDPSVDYLGPYRSVESSFGGEFDLTFDPNLDRRHVRVTPDGRYLLIQTKLAYDPVADRDPDADLYRWDEADGWMCVSCQPPGVPSAGDVDVFQPHLGLEGGKLNLTNPMASGVPESTISDDGQRVFFSTPDALVPQDVNGEPGCPIVDAGGNQVFRCQDIYEWHDGTVSLISSGTGAEPVVPIGATHAGKDVFFMTPQRLVGRDVDNGTDIYDAHIGGGYPEPPAQPPTCEGEACRGEGTIAAASSSAGTAVFEGSGNPPAKHKKATRKHHKKRSHKHQRANHNRRAPR